MALPALTRGLILLEELMKHPPGLRYALLKQALPGVGDASFNRLISSLMESGHVEKENSLYRLTSHVLNWPALIKNGLSLEESIIKLVNELSLKTGESVGFCLYRDKKLIIQHSISCVDSISIIKPGQILHYEEDHAACLAVMDLLTIEEQEEALKSLWSTMTRPGWQAGRKEISKENYYADSSRLRVGISRLALPWQNNIERGALFLCLPSVRMKQREKELAEIMKGELNGLS